MYYFQFEVVAIMIYLITIFAILYKKMYILDTSKMLIGVSIIGIVASIIHIIIGSAKLGDKNELYLFTIYYIIRNVLTVWYALYALRSLRVVVFIKNNIIQILYLLIPFFISLITLIINFFTGFLINVNNGIAEFKGHIIISYMIPFIYMFLIGIMMIGIRKHYSKDRIITTIISLVIIALAMIAEMVFKDILLEMLGVSISVILLLLISERAEERIDPQTTTKKNYAFSHDMKIDFSYNKKETIILIWIQTFERMSALCANDDIIIIKKAYTKVLKQLIKNNKINSDIYYLNNGKYAVLVDPKDEEKILDFIEDYNNEIEGKNVCELSFSNIKSSLLVIKTGIDIKNYQFMMDFSRNFEKYLSFSDKNYILYNKLDDKEKKRFDLLADMPRIIARGIDDDMFEVFYQPIFNVKKQCFSSAEALLRLKDGCGGYFSPVIFIPVAEETGEIIRIGEYVYKEVCRFVISEKFKELGLDYIEINVSPKQLFDPNFADNFINIANDYNLDPSKINLEITESDSVINDSVVASNISRLHEFGFKFSLDDFGTGYSNTRHVLSLPINIVKIDKSFVSEILTNARMKPIAEKTISMFHSVDLSVVVEGIEGEESLNYFNNIGCDYIQGFYYSKPVCYDSFIKFIKENKK